MMFNFEICQNIDPQGIQEHEIPHKRWNINNFWWKLKESRNFVFRLILEWESRWWLSKMTLKGVIFHDSMFAR